MDSDDEFLCDLCRAPKIQTLPVVDSDSADEFLQELLTSPPGSTPLTLLACQPQNMPEQPMRFERPMRSELELVGETARELEQRSAKRLRVAQTVESSHVERGGNSSSSSSAHIRIVQVQSSSAGEGGGAHGAVSDHQALREFALSLGDLPTIDMPRQDDILWSVSPGDLERAYTHALRRFFAWHDLLEIIVFKVGIGSDPVDRYFNAEFGYVLENTWLCMDVVWKGPACDCRTLERRLIRSLKKNRVVTMSGMAVMELHLTGLTHVIAT